MHIPRIKSVPLIFLTWFHTLVGYIHAPALVSSAIKLIGFTEPYPYTSSLNIHIEKEQQLYM